MACVSFVPPDTLTPPPSHMPISHGLLSSGLDCAPASPQNNNSAKICFIHILLIVKIELTVSATLNAAEGLDSIFSDSMKKAAAQAAPITQLPSCPITKFLTGYFFQLLLVYIEIRIHILHVVLIFQGLQQADHLVGGCAFELDVVLRNHPDLRMDHFDVCFFDGLQDRFKSPRHGDDLPALSVVAQA